VSSYLCVYENGSEKDEVAEFRMNDIPVNPHVPESRRHRNRLMRNDPRFSLAEAIHLHREPHSWVQGSNTALFKHCHNLAGYFIERGATAAFT
jgi:hypothetical protein